MDLINYIIIALFLVLFVWSLILTFKLMGIKKSAKILFDIKNPKNLAKIVEDYIIDVRTVGKQNQELNQKIKILSQVARSGLHKSGFVRYNPFGNVGGNQSFSLCLLNAKNNGFVISSIHSREGTRVYSKTVSGGESDYNLSEEEKKAIKIAVGEKE